MQCHNNKANNSVKGCWLLTTECLGIRQLKTFVCWQTWVFWWLFSHVKRFVGLCFQQEPDEVFHNPLTTLSEVHGAKNYSNKITTSLRKMSAASSGREQVFSHRIQSQEAAAFKYNCQVISVRWQMALEIESFFIQQMRLYSCWRL